MKKLKNVWLFLSFILMVAGMASCSTDDVARMIRRVWMCREMTLSVHGR